MSDRPNMEDGSMENVNARDLMGDLEARLARAEEERDLAIAHDTQPYPTADAYEKVCAARTKWQQRLERLEAGLETVAAAFEHRSKAAHDLRPTTVAEMARDSAIWGSYRDAAYDLRQLLQPPSGQSERGESE